MLLLLVSEIQSLEVDKFDLWVMVSQVMWMTMFSTLSALQMSKKLVLVRKLTVLSQNPRENSLWSLRSILVMSARDLGKIERWVTRVEKSVELEAHMTPVEEFCFILSLRVWGRCFQSLVAGSHRV